MLKYHPFHYQTFFCSFSFFNFPSLSLLYILVYIRIFQCEQAHFQLINSRLFYVKRGIYYKRLVYIINTWCEPRFTDLPKILKIIFGHRLYYLATKILQFFVKSLCKSCCNTNIPGRKIEKILIRMKERKEKIQKNII